jgi:hypothetical protein
MLAWFGEVRLLEGAFIGNEFKREGSGNFKAKKREDCAGIVT